MTAPRPRRPQRADVDQFEHWKMFLVTGHDFFGALERIGLDGRYGPENLPRGVARAAWRRYGARVLAGFEPSDYRRKPWGYQQFGKPPG